MLSQRVHYLAPCAHWSARSEALWLFAGAAHVTLDKLSTKDLIKFLKEYTHRHKKLPGREGAVKEELEEPKRGIVIPADASTLPTAVAIVKVRQHVPCLHVYQRCVMSLLDNPLPSTLRNFQYATQRLLCVV